MRYFLFFIFLFSINILASTPSKCTKYELESDEKFEIKALGNDNFLVIYSKNFDMSFFLKCPNGTSIYAKTMESSLEDKDNFLKIETKLQKDAIEILNYKNEGYIKEIKFSIEDKALSSLTEENIIYINENNDKNIVYQLNENNKNRPTLPLSFQCSKEYFFNKYRIKSLSFENEQLNADYIISEISKWAIKGHDNNNERLISWFIDCQTWVNLIKGNNLEELHPIDKQIIFQSSKAHKKSRDLLIDLQQKAISNENLNNQLPKDFENIMNSLKVLEKNKSKYKIFTNINNTFYLKNDKSLASNINYILAYNQNSYYYDLLSNTKIGSFNDTSNFKLDFIPLKLSIFSLDENKNFLVIKMESSVELMSKNTQFTIYKLSNSFCSFLNTKINNMNKKISEKIDLLAYCYDKKFGDTYKNASILVKQNQYVQINKPNIIANSPPPINTPLTQSNVKSECKNIDNGVFCNNVTKQDVSSQIKDGLRIPSLDELIDGFDDEAYEGSTIYAPNDKYFFFDEDSGWVDRDESDSHIIDLILIR